MYCTFKKYSLVAHNLKYHTQKLEGYVQHVDLRVLSFYFNKLPFQFDRPFDVTISIRIAK